MMHWGWASCSVSWSRIVRRESVVQCAVWGKLTSSGGSASLAARKWGLGFERFVRTISPTILGSACMLPAEKKHQSTSAGTLCPSV